MKSAISTVFLLKNVLLHACYLGFDWSGRIVVIKSEIIISTRMIWPVSSDKWKAPLEITFLEHFWSIRLLPGTVYRVNICCNIFLYSSRLPYASSEVTFPSLLFTFQVTLHHASLPWFYSRNMWQLRPRTLRGQFPIERCGSNRLKRWYFFLPYFVLCINILMTYSLKIVCTVPEVNYAVLLFLTDPCFSLIYLVFILHVSAFVVNSKFTFDHKNLPKCN